MVGDGSDTMVGFGQVGFERLDFTNWVWIFVFQNFGLSIGFEYRGFDIKIGLGFGVWVFLGLMQGIGFFRVLVVMRCKS